MKYLIVLVLLFLPQILSADYSKKVDAFMEELKICESGGDVRAYHPNDGGSESISLYQFKRATFAHYMKKYEGVVPRGDIWNPVTQTALARQMLLEPDGWKHWRICSLRIGLLPHMT